MIKMSRDTCIETAQEEMKIIADLVKNNSKIIMQVRSFFIVALTALLGYIIKEIIFKEKVADPPMQDAQDAIGKILCYKLNEFGQFILLALSLMVMAFAVELIITTWQNAHINRLSFLDKTINMQIFGSINEVPKVFTEKNINQDSWISVIWNAAISPSFAIFYLLTLLIIAILHWIGSKSLCLLGLAILISCVYVIYLLFAFKNHKKVKNKKKYSLKIVLREMNTIKENYILCRKYFPLLIEEASNEKLKENIRKNNEVAHWINQNFLVRLYAILEHFQIVTKEIPIDKQLEGAEEIRLLRWLRNVFAHSSGKYNPKKKKHRNLAKKIIKHFKLDRDTPEDFHIPIEPVCLGFFEKCKKYVEEKYESKK